MDIFLVKSDQRGEAHSYYDILIHCQLPTALAEELMGKINKSLELYKKTKELIKKHKEDPIFLDKGCMIDDFEKLLK